MGLAFQPGRTQNRRRLHTPTRQVCQTLSPSESAMTRQQGLVVQCPDLA